MTAPATFRCRDCGDEVTTEDRGLAGEPCRFFGPYPEPACAGTYRRVWHAPSVVLNGPGFYSTDHRKG